jgi:hypothetical protein
VDEVSTLAAPFSDIFDVALLALFIYLVVGGQVGSPIWCLMMAMAVGQTTAVVRNEWRHR